MVREMTRHPSTGISGPPKPSPSYPARQQHNHHNYLRTPTLPHLEQRYYPNVCLVLPGHIRILPRFQRTLEARWTTATVRETNDLYPLLVLPIHLTRRSILTRLSFTSFFMPLPPVPLCFPLLPLIHPIRPSSPNPRFNPHSFRSGHSALDGEGSGRTWRFEELLAWTLPWQEPQPGE